MTDWPEDGTDAPVSEVTMPAEALLRLSYGRLDPAHTPASVTGDPADLDQLRAIFPGFWPPGAAPLQRRAARAAMASLAASWAQPQDSETPAPPWP